MAGLEISNSIFDVSAFFTWKRKVMPQYIISMDEQEEKTSE